MIRLDKISRAAVDALEDVKAHDIVVFDVKKMTAFFDKVIVATGDSNRQCRALASRVQEQVKAAGGKVYGIEGEKTGERRSRRDRHRDFRKPREAGAEGAPREGKPEEKPEGKREERGDRGKRFEGKGKERDGRDKSGDRGGRDRDKGGRRDRESGPALRQYASSANPRDRGAADPNSPFAKLAALKEQLARKD